MSIETVQGLDSIIDDRVARCCVGGSGLSVVAGRSIIIEDGCRISVALVDNMKFSWGGYRSGRSCLQMKLRVM